MMLPCELALWRSLAALALLATLAGCATAPAMSPELRQQLGQQLGTVRERLYAYVAMERTRSGEAAKNLAIDSELMAAAQAHSDEMASRRAFDATGGGDNLAMRRLMTNQEFQGLVGENIAMVYVTPQSGIDPDMVARAFMEIWLNSADHRGNLVFPGFDRTGIGLAINGNQIYAAQLFATDLGLAPRP